MQRRTLLSLAVSVALGGALPAVYAQSEDAQPETRTQGTEQHDRFYWDRNEFRDRDFAMHQPGTRHASDRRDEHRDLHRELREERRDLREAQRDHREFHRGEGHDGHGHHGHAPVARAFDAGAHRRGSVSRPIERLDPRTSFLQWLPGVHRYYRYLLPFMPAAVGWDLPACDLVVSFSHCVAKAVAPPPGVPHVCYCFTPMRYAWHMRKAYFAAGGRKSLKGRLAAPLLAALRHWDRSTADRVSHFIAISRTVQQRIAECYGRDSTVIYPPVDTEAFGLSMHREDYYVTASRLVPYCSRSARPSGSSTISATL